MPRFPSGSGMQSTPYWVRISSMIFFGQTMICLTFLPPIFFTDSTVFCKVSRLPNVGVITNIFSIINYIFCIKTSRLLSNHNAIMMANEKGKDNLKPDGALNR